MFVEREAISRPGHLLAEWALGLWMIIVSFSRPPIWMLTCVPALLWSWAVLAGLQGFNMCGSLDWIYIPTFVPRTEEGGIPY